MYVNEGKRYGVPAEAVETSTVLHLSLYAHVSWILCTNCNTVVSLAQLCSSLLKSNTNRLKVVLLSFQKQKKNEPKIPPHSYKVAQTLINWRKPPLLHFSCLVRAGTPSSKRCLLCLVQGHLCSGSDVYCQSHLHSPAQTLLIRLLCNLVLWGEMTQHSIH